MKFLLFHKTLSFQPEQTIMRPRVRVGKGGFVRESHAVPALLVNVQIKRHMVFP